MKDRPLLPIALATRCAAQTPLKLNPVKRATLSKTYDVDHTRVLVTWQVCTPEDKEPLPGRAVLFLPGWPLRAESGSIRRLTRALANSAAARTYVLHTRSEDIIPAPLYQEAQAICQFLIEMQLSHITLVGYSQGGIKAMNITVLLQEMQSDIHVEGLILIVPVGLVEMGRRELVRKYIMDSLFTSFVVILCKMLNSSSFRKKMHSLAESSVLIIYALLAFFHALFKEIKTSQRSYLARFKNDLGEMSRINPYLSKIRVPVVLVQGSRDFVSDRARMLAQIKSQLRQEHLRDISEEEAVFGEQRLVETLFPQSPAIVMVKAQTFGSHLLPLLRSESIARVSLYLLRRFQRRDWTDTQEPKCEKHPPLMLQSRSASNSLGDTLSEFTRERL